jgi:hypothetical protein
MKRAGGAVLLRRSMCGSAGLPESIWPLVRFLVGFVQNSPADLPVFWGDFSGWYKILDEMYGLD